MVKPETQLYRFGPFRLDTVRRVLLRDESPVQLPSRAFDVLLALIEHSQYVIDKDELMRLVWGDRVVEENNLTRHISTLRRVLDESPNDHRYIVTLPGRGYSFVAPVESVPTNGGQSFPSNQNGNSSAHDTNRNGLETFAHIVPADRATITSESLKPGHAKGGGRKWFWAMALLVVVASGLLGFRLVNTRSKPTPVKIYRDWDIVRLTRTGGSVNPDISRDGKYLAYLNIEAGRQSVWILELATSARHQIVAPEKFAYFGLQFTPDGSDLYFVRREGSTPMGTLYKISAHGGVAKKLREDLESPVVISPDGDHLAFTRRNSEGKSEFLIASADGVEERVLVGRRLQCPAWSPDGSVIAYSVGDASSGGETMSIQGVRLNDGTTEELSSRTWSYVSNKSWLPDGSGLIVCARDQKVNANRLWFVAYPTGEAHPLSDDFDHFKSLSLTADARMLATEQITPFSDIWSGPLTDMPSAKKISVWGTEGLCLVPDGRIVYSSVQAGETNKLWIASPEGTERKQLTADGGNDISPVASPDGRYIVFASNRSGNFDIWRMNIDGSNLRRLTSSTGANPPSISPDGRWVIYLSTVDNNLHKVSIEGGDPLRVADTAVGVSAVSPDEKLIAYFAPGKNTWGIALSSFQDGSVIRRFEIGSHSLNNTSLKWTPDGKALLYSVSSDGVANIWMQPLDGSPPKQVTDFKSDGIFRFDVSPDGKNLICARGGWKHDIVLIKNLR